MLHLQTREFTRYFAWSTLQRFIDNMLNASSLQMIGNKNG